MQAPPPQETPGPGRLPRRIKNDGLACRRTPEGTVDRDPGDASRRDPRREVGDLPEGVLVSQDRIEMRFNGAKDAVGRLYALAHAFVNDYERFEELVDGGVGGGGEVSE